jgi:peptide/nickel transport system permease protein
MMKKTLDIKTLHFFSFAFKNVKFKIGFALFTSIVLISIVGSLATPYDPSIGGKFRPNEPPSISHLLGTDSMGRDILAQIFLGTVQSLIIGLIVAFVGTVVGSTLGFMAGYYGGLIDAFFRTIIDTFVVVPMLPILILISSFFRTVSIWLVAGILSMFSWAWPARQIRSQTFSLKERDFISVAKLSGMSGSEIILKEIMPHMLQWMIANFVNAVLWSMLTEAGLEILGLGPQTTITLGMMLYWANVYSALLRNLWWWWFPPLTMLILLFLSLYLIHNGLDELLNPRSRKG